MVLERGRELLVSHLGDELRKHLVCELPFDVEDVAELVQEQVARVVDLGHSGSPLAPLGEPVYTVCVRGKPRLRRWAAADRKSAPVGALGRFLRLSDLAGSTRNQASRCRFVRFAASSDRSWPG